MKLINILIFVALQAITLNVQAQTTAITIHAEHVQLSQVIEHIEHQSGYLFFYKDNDVKNIYVSVSADKAPIETVLSQALKGSNLNFTIQGRSINIVRKEIPKRYTISGYVKDASSGESLIGATIYIKDLNTGTTSNAFGFYSAELPEGEHEMQCSYVGMKTFVQKVKLSQNTQKNISLSPNAQQLKEVVVTSSVKELELKKPDAGVEKLSGTDISSIPAPLGEADISKALALLPGVQATSEGNTSFSVRGGGVDQNLVLLDDAPVYSIGHLLGLFSAFNADAIKNAELHKGDMSAQYGGRLSSLLDIRMRDGNSQRFSATGGLGTVTSRLMLEGPIVSNKLTFMLSGRGIYPIKSNEDDDNFLIYFYDFNGKLVWTINKNNKLYFSVFYGKDVIGGNLNDQNNDIKLDFTNNTQTLRWNHIFSQKLFSNITFVNSDYTPTLTQNVTEEGINSYKRSSELKSQGLKDDFTWYPNLRNTVDFGIQGTYYTINPITIKAVSDKSLTSQFNANKINALELSAYISNTQKVTDQLTLRYGLRFSQFRTLGKTTQYYYKEDHSFDYEKDFGAGKTIKSYQGIEPRFSSSFAINPNTSIKASYSRYYQYIQQAIYSASGSPFDIWFTASPTVKPQISDQFSLGIFKLLHHNAIEASANLFYKNNQNAIAFKDHPQLMVNEKTEGELRFGKSYAYGLECQVKFNFNRFNGSLNYTYSDSKYKIPEINGGEAYRSPLSHKHDFSIMASYDLSKRVKLSANWVYYSGMPTSFPIARYEVGGNLLPIYSERRNEDKYPDYHRLDLSVVWRKKERPNKRWHGEWAFSLYNAYGRKNAWSIYFDYDKSNQRVVAKKYYLYTFVPSVSYNFKF